MATLHLLPTDSAGGSMRQALREAGLDDAVLAMPDDLSCGPIATGDVPERVEWWARFYERATIETRLQDFWRDLATSDARLVLWFGRRDADELACFYACADHLGDRAYLIVDVGPNRTSTMRPAALRSLFGTEQLISLRQRLDVVERWRRLRAENAPFRVVTPAGLVSAPIDYFDHWLLAHASESPRRAISLVGEAMAEFSGQVGNVMLEERIAALVESGALIAEGDPGDILAMRIRRET